MISHNCPGTLVADFETLLDFIGSGVRSTGKYDFGANWQFTVKLEKVKPPNPTLRYQ